MDSYPENHETRLGDLFANFLMVTTVLAIAAITAGAMVGIDITNPQPNNIQRAR